MTVTRVTQVIAESETSFEDAICCGIARAKARLANVQGAWVQQCRAHDDARRRRAYRVAMKVAYFDES